LFNQEINDLKNETTQLKLKLVNNTNDLGSKIKECEDLKSANATQTLE